MSHIRPWENITIDPSKPASDDTDESDEEEDRDWWLPDDPSGLDAFFKDDDGWKSGSPWNKWRASPSEPLICVLVLKSWASSIPLRENAMGMKRTNMRR